MGSGSTLPIAALAVFLGGGCVASSVGPEPEAPEPVERPTLDRPPSSTADLHEALTTIANAGIDLRAPLEPWELPSCAELIALEPDALLESFVVVTHHDRDPVRRRSALRHHIRIRLARCDFRGAAPLLESYLREDASAPDAVSTAVLLTDLRTVAWLLSREPVEVIDASEALEAWLLLVPSLAVWSHPDAVVLRRAVVMLRASLMMAECRPDGSIYCDGVGDPVVDGYRRCAEAFDELALQHPDSEDVEALRRSASELREASEQPGPCARD